MFKSAKRKHFEQMLKDIDRAIWELELKKFTLLNSREQYRRRLDNATEVLEHAKKGDNKELKEKAQAELDNAKRIVLALDREIAGGQGAEPSKEYPDGLPEVQGVDNQLTSWVERREIAKQFIKYNC